MTSRGGVRGKYSAAYAQGVQIEVDDSMTEPRNAVDNPILNSPFEEPHRYYDFSGVTPRILEGRRQAGYHGTVRTEQMHDAEASSYLVLPSASGERYPRAGRAVASKQLPGRDVDHAGPPRPLEPSTRGGGAMSPSFASERQSRRSSG